MAWRSIHIMAGLLSMALGVGAICTLYSGWYIACVICCGLMLVIAKLFGNEDWHRHRKVLKKYVDPDHGLLDKLLNREALERDEIANVRAGKTYFERNSKLMEYIFKKRNKEDFLFALKDSDQKHIASYIQRDGGVFNKWQQQTISSKATAVEKIQTLLGILPRRSRGDYNNTIHCLRNTNQGHIARILENGGAIVRIHSQVRYGLQENEGIDAAIFASFAHALQDPYLDHLRRIHILNEVVEVIEMRRVKSADYRFIFSWNLKQNIYIYVLCKTSQELAQLPSIRNLTSGLRSFFVRLLKSVQIKNLEVNKEDLENMYVEAQLHVEEYERCNTYLSRSTMRLESSIIVFGTGYIGSDVFKINLNRPDEVSALQQLPIAVKYYDYMAAAVYCGSVFVTGVGTDNDEIWRFDARCSKWIKCASLIKGRSRHSVAFVDHILYMCGGRRFYRDALHDVEAYDAIDDKCSVVGKLAYAVQNAGNGVPYKTSLYVFGGSNAHDEILNKVQVYNTELNCCTILGNPMPRKEGFLCAALFKNYAILLGDESCFLYNFDTKTWEVRDQLFKNDVVRFGVTVHAEKLFVIGGRDSQGIRRDDVRYAPTANILNDVPIEWKHHAKLPRPLEVNALGKLEFSVNQI